MVELKNEAEIKKIEKSCQMVADVLRKLKEMVRPGLSTLELDNEAVKMTRKFGARPAFLNYRGYPKSVCVSINEQVVHGIPSKDRKIRDGDIVSLDFGVEYDGYFGDAALSVAAGRLDEKAARLIDITEKALYAGIAQARPGKRLGDISAAVQKFTEANGFSVVRDFVGHGIGKKMHEDPMVPNYGEPGTGILLEAGMVLAIEPMVNEKGWEVVVLEDEWTVVTKDNGRSAHFEHTIAITKDGPVILSK
jgi:methionyl aminopeptidase